MTNGKLLVRSSVAVVFVACSGGATGGAPQGSGESAPLLTSALSAAGFTPTREPSNRATPAALLASALSAPRVVPNARDREVSATDTTAATAEETAAATRSPAARPLGDEPDYVIATGGRKFHKSCVHKVPDNARIDANQDVWLDGNKIDHIAPCPYSHVFSTSPWVTGATQLANNFYTAMTAEFSVPPPPSANNTQAPVGIWPGIETYANSSGDSYVMQPVLEYQQPGGSAQWTMQNMVVLGNNLIESDTPIVVSQGQWINTIFEIDYTNPGSGCQGDGSNCQYVFGWQNASTNGPWHTLPITVAMPWVWAQGAIFEAAQPSNFLGCNDFPAGTSAGTYFLNINFYEVNSSQSGLSGLFWPDAYNPVINQPGSGNFQYPDGNGQTLHCGFQSAEFTSFFGAATNGVFIGWNSTMSPQDRNH